MQTKERMSWLAGAGACIGTETSWLPRMCGVTAIQAPHQSFITVQGPMHWWMISSRE